jgi:hypothetical protein
MKCIFLFGICAFIAICMSGQQVYTDKSKTTKNGKSNLIFVDSAKLADDFLNFAQTKDFLLKTKDSNLSFGSTCFCIFYKSQSFLRREPRYNLFDSVAVNFTYEYVLNYKFRELKKRTSNKVYWLYFTYIYNNEDKALFIKVEDATSKPFVKIYSRQISIKIE